ncbi:Sfi1-domain-containing protein [Hortaea werneckii]|uniref:Sfi1 spindle body domain-containing protein n=1 Tax=Hortaea werneckii TaxID=91943 RepID=A0A3M7IAM9_HORWE|nr:Sfi1-domain-containing protein [Hortaea werneckii]KAI6851611.1 Sfi1-domain-containing protein [Hortaea werneckii]KAI6929505.1 Sfi1-domain-containing protein [Hortaea werneckii]KAI6943986.1 Sfi1-domain-containing protein [Hortaea werneckii]KAI6982518.1 Sfi1-domain-containing protein [Hortaea werneckii]
MNENAAHDELDFPELTDDEVSLAHQITTRAQKHYSALPSYKALFAAYDDVFREQGLESEHDSHIFRVLLRVGATARERGHERGGTVDLVGCLTSLLEAHGITVIDYSESGELEAGEEDTKSVAFNGPGTETQARINGVGAHHKKSQFRAEKRRVSFGDAKLDETWLSEHSRSLAPSPSENLGPWQNQHFLAQPARKGRSNSSSGQGRRTRSTSSRRHHAYPRTHQRTKEDTRQSSNDIKNETAYYDQDTNGNPTLLFEPSQTQLEANADAFFSTSTIRIARRALHIWHDAAIYTHQNNVQAFAIATAHDRRTLVKQAFDVWRSAYVESREERRLEEKCVREEKKWFRGWEEHIVDKAFTHWRQATFDQRDVTELAKKRILQVRYFSRWKALTVENARKCRLVLSKKYLTLWRERLTRTLHRQHQAEAHHEDALARRCWKSWFWRFCDRKVDSWREEKVMKRTLDTWRQRVAQMQAREQQSEDHYNNRLSRIGFGGLQKQLTTCQQNDDQASTLYDRRLKKACLRTITIHANLAPIAKTFTLKINLDLQRRAFKTWHLRVQLERQAAEVDRQRVLQSAWTRWNDNLRCRALGQRIDERVLVESLYKWALAEREQLFSRTMDGKALRRAFGWWRYRAGEAQDKLTMAERVFAEQQHRRHLAQAMGCLNREMRRLEDLDRMAVEFANARVLPRFLHGWAEKARHAMELQRWAGDARFYTLATRSLVVWRERTTQHVNARRRGAYTHVRGRMKVRIVRNCFGRWRDQAVVAKSMDGEAEYRLQEKNWRAAIEAFSRWQEKTTQVRESSERADALDRTRLVVSALAAIAAAHSQHQELERQADEFRHEQELVLMGAMMKKLQWTQFTAARRAESAEALLLRNRDQHIRQMLRHWALLTADRRTTRANASTPKGPEDDEPESPSLGPASRQRATSRSRERPGFLPLSPPDPTATPGYLRTPSRSSRRAGRFRPLPTPRGMTPFTFGEGYLSTTPAPLPSIQQTSRSGAATDVVPSTTEQESEERNIAGNEDAMSTLTPQITPFARKLRAGGFGASNIGTSTVAATPGPSVLRSSVFGRSVLGGGGGGTAKSVRFAGGGGDGDRWRGSRAGRMDERHEKSS